MIRKIRENGKQIDLFEEPNKTSDFNTKPKIEESLTRRDIPDKSEDRFDYEPTLEEEWLIQQNSNDSKAKIITEEERKKRKKEEKIFWEDLRKKLEDAKPGKQTDFDL